MIKELPEDIKKFIDQYAQLNIDGSKVQVPYYRNVKRVRGELRSLVGKGTPSEIIEDARIYAKLRGFDLKEATSDQIKRFLEKEGIGVDCSGYVSHVLDQWLRSRGNGSLQRNLKFPQDSLIRKMIRIIRPIENISADNLTDSANSFRVKLKDVQPGDLIKSSGVVRGDHVLLVYEVHTDGDQVKRIVYTHSREKYGENNGVAFGEIEITDPTKPLSKQKWLELDKDGVNHTYAGYMREKKRGIRRLNFYKKLT